MTQNSTLSLNKLSEDLLLAVKMQESTKSFTSTLKELAIKELLVQLDTDPKKKAFWINIYNAYYQILRTELMVDKSKVYTKKCIEIGQKNWSLDHIEHGILRKYRWKYSLGYFAQFFPNPWVKKLAVERIDYRIHFALNCGAESCPPIAFYSPEKIENQLNRSTVSFLKAETQVDEKRRTVNVSRILFWFSGDFGGKKGIRKILADKIGLNIQGFKISYNKYNWDDHLANFV